MTGAGGPLSPRQRRIRFALVLLLLVVAAYGAYRQSRANRQQPNRPAPGVATSARSGKSAEHSAESRLDANENNRESTNSASTIVRDQTILDLDGEVAFQGDVDLTATLARIKADQGRPTAAICQRRRDVSKPRTTPATKTIGILQGICASDAGSFRPGPAADRRRPGSGDVLHARPLRHISAFG